MHVAPVRSSLTATSTATAHGARLLCRDGGWTGPTAGMAPGRVQGNLVVLPEALAGDFLRFCQKNPRPCPLLHVSEPGEFLMPELGEDLDIRTDLPRYRVWRDGVLAKEPTSLLEHWRGDLVSFVIGCSFSFEEALLAAGVPVRHIACNSNVPMYRTNQLCRSAGPFAGPLVVSMRPMRPADAIRAVQVTSRFPSVHGAPVHLGLPEEIGIADLSRPDYGDPPELRPGELPVFWACGVTPQAVLEQARPPFAITHAPGCMVVTDLLNADLAVL